MTDKHPRQSVRREARGCSVLNDDIRIVIVPVDCIGPRLPSMRGISDNRLCLPWNSPSSASVDVVCGLRCMNHRAGYGTCVEVLGARDRLEA